MASREHEFLGMEKANTNTNTQPRRHCFRRISKIHPEIVKTVMASAAEPPPPSLPTLLPLYHPPPFPGETNTELEIKGQTTDTDTDTDTETKPVTIFYNGSVSVFHLPTHKVESLLNFVKEKTTCMKENGTILDSIHNGEFPIKRNKSLQRFLEKRRHRLISVAPYSTNVSTKQLHRY